MAGAGSALDRADYKLLERLVRGIERQAEATERIADALEDNEDE
jgi:hypothetical protein